jgi:hypothetical protein
MQGHATDCRGDLLCALGPDPDDEGSVQPKRGHANATTVRGRI